MEDFWKKYDKKEYIGSCSYRNVYKGKNKLTSEYVAIKEINKMRIKTNKVILNMIKIMEKLKSENSVLLIETFETSDCYYIISEYCYMSLEEYMNKRNNCLSIEEIKELLLDLNKGLKKIVIII